MADEPWSRLAERVKARRYELRLTQTQLAREAGTSDRTIGAIERAEQSTYQASTLRSISIALRWTPESIDLILAGQEPIEADGRGIAPTSRSVEERLDELEAEIAKLRRRIGGKRNGDAA